MGKSKGGKKTDVINEAHQTEPLDDQLDDELPIRKAGKNKNKKEKQPAKETVAEDNDSDVEDLSKKVKAMKVKGKKGKSKKSADSDDDDVPVGRSAKKNAGFSLLMADEDDDGNDEDVYIPQFEEIDSDEAAKKDKKNKKGKKVAVQNDEAEAEPVANTGGKKSKKSKKKRNDSDEDIDKVLAELELEYTTGVKAQPAKSEPTGDNEEDDAAKQAAQKKKEKRERQKREAQMKQQGLLPETPAPAPAPAPAPVEEVTAGDNEEKDADVADKKKKKKKTKEEREAEKEQSKKKGPNKAMVAAMQEALAKKKEEDERLKLELEEKMRKAEELEQLRLEQIRLEQERKEKKKQKDLDRKARLKAEGKLLTAKQKQDRARAQQLLEALKAQGVDLPEAGEKRSRPGTRIRPKKKDQQDNKQDDQKTEEEQQDNGDEGEEEQEGAKSEVESVKEAWDASSDEETTVQKKPPAAKKQAPAKVPSSAKKETTPSESESEEESSEDDDSDESDDDSEEKDTDKLKKEKVWERIQKRRVAADQKKSLDDLRSAVVCVLGHVDTGKTKILDRLRRTNVQDGEAGGITQQIGATNVPIENIKEQVKVVRASADMNYKLPGLLIIDTPGHESFSNLRNRGSSLCDIAILVVDIMHGLEPQTIESINILKSKKTPFVVALNKIDRLYDWESNNKRDVKDVIKSQSTNTLLEFQERSNSVIVQFAEQGLNAALYYDNPDPRTYVNLVPTSAITGEGIGNLLFLIVEICQSWIAKRLMYSEDLLATVLEVKAIPGLGTTIDAILINGKLREGDTIVIAGTDGPIVTQIRSLLMPQPMKELRVKNAYIEHKEVKGAQGVKIAAKELEKAIAGLNIAVAQKNDEVDYFREEVAKDLKSALSSIKLSERGVYVQASTLGSLEALLEFLKSSKIPYSAIRIGPVVKRDVMKASTMLEHESEYATILAFDVKVERDAQEMADSLGVKIFQADIIYHLFDKFTAYREELKAKKKEEFKHIAVFPCKLKILPQFIFNSRDPIVCGVIVEAGIVKEGTPICVPAKEFVDVGIVTSIEQNHKTVDSARKGMEVCIKIEPIPGESPKMIGRHFEETDMLVSKISRQSIDACKDYFRDDLQKSDWALMVELKKLFQIM